MCKPFCFLVYKQEVSIGVFLSIFCLTVEKVCVLLPMFYVWGGGRGTKAEILMSSNRIEAGWSVVFDTVLSFCYYDQPANCDCLASSCMSPDCQLVPLLVSLRPEPACAAALI